jgi:hypothetical protein
VCLDPSEDERIVERDISEGDRTYTKEMELHAANEAVQSFVCPVDLSFLKLRK